jgi:hypothetical protein
MLYPLRRRELPQRYRVFTRSLYSRIDGRCPELRNSDVSNYDALFTFNTLAIFRIYSQAWRNTQPVRNVISKRGNPIRRSSLVGMSFALNDAGNFTVSVSLRATGKKLRAEISSAQFFSGSFDITTTFHFCVNQVGKPMNPSSSSLMYRSVYTRTQGGRQNPGAWVNVPSQDRPVTLLPSTRLNVNKGRIPGMGIGATPVMATGLDSNASRVAN